VEPQIAQAIATIAADSIAGAVEIAERSADVLLRRARMGDERADVLRRDLLEVGWALIQGHPTMAPLVNLVNLVLWRSESADEAPGVRQAVVDAISEFKRRLRVHEAAIAERALTLLRDGAQIVTIGRSTTVRAALRHAQRAGRRFRVICAEGRPALEGRALAEELAEQGIPVTLVVDALAIVTIRSSQLLLVGADHLTAEALVNKVGTYGLALAAQASRVPAYALCGSDKFLPMSYVPPHQSQWPAAQVWGEAPQSIAIENLYVDHTPISALAGIVTEQGILSTVGIESWFAAIKLHPALKPVQ
jgi:translation initiation factor eIF-2B subunit delta